LLVSLLAIQFGRTAKPNLPGLPPACAVRVLRYDARGAMLRCAGADRRDGDQVREGVVARMAGPALRLLGLPVDVNHGSVEDLEALPGIGPKLAERMLTARPFRTVAELQRVAGIGPKRWAQLEPLVIASP
jgi:hypothetical protein